MCSNCAGDYESGTDTNTDTAVQQAELDEALAWERLREAHRELDRRNEEWESACTILRLAQSVERHSR